MDLCWRMPLDDSYADTLKSNFADVANVGGRDGGAIIAAKFLHRFTKKYPWAHLDVGADYRPTRKWGVGVRLGAEGQIDGSSYYGWVGGVYWNWYGGTGIGLDL